MRRHTPRLRAASIVAAVTLIGTWQWAAGDVLAEVHASKAYQSQRVRGWQVYVHERLRQERPEQTALALRLLESQLKYIETHVPHAAVKALRKVPLWFSPPYEGERPRAEYHPNVQWLRAHGRPDAMEKCVEFSNIPIFAKEVERMPVLW